MSRFMSDKRSLVNPIEAFTLDGGAQTRGSFPHLKRAGDLLFVSGTSSRRPDNSIAGASLSRSGEKVLCIRSQTEEVIGNIDKILATAGASIQDLVEVTAFLVDMSDFDVYNETYGKFFTERGPARTTVGVRELPHPDLLIEMKAVAFKPLDEN